MLKHLQQEEFRGGWEATRTRGLAISGTSPKEKTGKGTQTRVDGVTPMGRMTKKQEARESVVKAYQV